jgi:DNA-binding GntR family transcriptional regulator
MAIRSCSSRHPPTIHDEHMTVYVVRGRRGEEHHRSRDVGRVSATAQSGPRSRLVRVGGVSRLHVGSSVDAIDGNTSDENRAGVHSHPTRWCTSIAGSLSVGRNTMPSALPPLPRSSTTSDLVVDTIREAILGGRLAPGETLVERRLAEQLGVSKTPVREALIALAATGLVTVAPNRGAVVRAVNTGDVHKAYEVRLLLEPWAVARTVRDGGLPSATAAARAALDEAGRHLPDADHVQLSLANRRFHRALYAPCGNEIVVRQLDALQELAALGAVALLWERWRTWRAEHDEHVEILRAVEAGAAETAERLLRKHIRQSVRRLEPARPPAGQTVAETALANPARRDGLT